MVKPGEVSMTTQQRAQIDSVTLSVINNAFVNVCREMGTAMMRTSSSPPSSRLEWALARSIRLAAL
jgi:hypothetical protein